MESAPGFNEVIRQWSVDPVWMALGTLALLAYGFGFRRARNLGFQHPGWRFAMFGAGVLLTVISILSPIEHYSRQLLWVDFTGFLLLTMIVPPLILLGAPLTLAFRASGGRGRAQWRSFYRSRAVATLTFPVVTWLLFAVATYLWQFSALTEWAQDHAAVRGLQQASLLLVGLLFWMPAIAADPIRWRLNYPLRTLYVFVEMTHKSLFGGMFLSMNTAMHASFAAQAPPWAPDALTDQRMAILILWIGGNLIFVVALVGLIIGWIRYEQRNQHRTDYRLRLQSEAKLRRRAALEKVFEKSV